MTLRLTSWFSTDVLDFFLVFSGDMIVPHLHLLESGVWPLQGPQKLGDPGTDGGTNGQTPGCGGRGATKGAAGPQEKEVIPPDPQGILFFRLQ